LILGNDAGHVRVWERGSTSTWTQRGGDLDGEKKIDESGNAVSLSGDGSVVAGVHRLRRFARHCRRW
jgi:hypothetical protein